MIIVDQHFSTLELSIRWFGQGLGISFHLATYSTWIFHFPYPPFKFSTDSTSPSSFVYLPPNFYYSSVALHTPQLYDPPALNSKASLILLALLNFGFIVQAVQCCFCVIGIQPILIQTSSAVQITFTSNIKLQKSSLPAGHLNPLPFAFCWEWVNKFALTSYWSQSPSALMSPAALAYPTALSPAPPELVSISVGNCIPASSLSFPEPARAGYLAYSLVCLWWCLFDLIPFVTSWFGPSDPIFLGSWYWFLV